MRVGFIGLGAMGRPMAKRLLASSHEIYIFDVLEEAVRELEGLGAQRCTTPLEVGKQTAATFMSLPNAGIVTRVVSGAEGILAGSATGHVIIDLSSVDPGCSRRMAELCRIQEIGYIDAPVSGGVAGAANGTLTIMAGGEKQILEKVSELLEVLGKTIHVGDVGAGGAIKIVNNLLLGANMAALAEALVLGRKLGLKGSTMAEIIGQSSGKSYVFDAKLEKFILKNNFDPGFAIDLQHKDLGLALDAANEVGMPLPMTSMATQLFQTARAKGLGNRDMSAVIRIWEELMDVEVRQDDQEQG